MTRVLIDLEEGQPVGSPVALLQHRVGEVGGVRAPGHLFDEPDEPSAMSVVGPVHNRVFYFSGKTKKYVSSSTKQRLLATEERKAIFGGE